MKAISTLTLIAVAAAFITPNSVQAGEKERAIIGGLIGGIVIGTVLADDNFDTRVSVGYNDHGRHYDNHGYWNFVSVKRWTPGYYERSCDRHGHPRKVWISGHYTWVKEKVWVSVNARSDHYGRSYRQSDRRNSQYDRHDNHRRGHGSQVARGF